MSHVYLHLIFYSNPPPLQFFCLYLICNAALPHSSASKNKCGRGEFYHGKHCVFLEPAQLGAGWGRERGRQTGYVVVLQAGSRKGNSPERPAWEWVSISDSVSRAPTLFPSLSLCPSPPPLSSFSFTFYLPLLLPFALFLSS